MPESGAFSGIAVSGLRELNRALAKADRDTRLGIRAEYRRFAEPVRMTAETLALEKIPRMKHSPKWAGMRIGLTQKVIYIAPKQRGTNTKRNFRRYARPNLANLLMTRAMQPALEQHRPQIEAGFAAMLDRIADDFNH